MVFQFFSRPGHDIDEIPGVSVQMQPSGHHSAIALFIINKTMNKNVNFKFILSELFQFNTLSLLIYLATE